MKTQNNSSAKKLITFLLYSLRGLFLWYALLVILLFINQIIPTVTGNNSDMGLPVVFKTTIESNLNIPDTNQVTKFNMYTGEGVVLTRGLPARVFYLSFSGILLYYSCILFMIHLICKMLINAREGTFLIHENAIRLRHIALLNIAVLLISILFNTISSSYLSDKLEFSGLEFSSLNSYSFDNWKYIFLYLFLLIIAEAFHLGDQLKQENDLTI